MTPPSGCCSDDRKKLQSPPTVKMADSSVWGLLSYEQIIYKFILGCKVVSLACVAAGHIAGSGP